MYNLIKSINSKIRNDNVEQSEKDLMATESKKIYIDLLMVESIIIVFLTYFAIQYSWSTTHSILVIGSFFIALGMLLNNLKMVSYARYFPYGVASGIIFLSSGAYGFESQIHMHLLLVFMHILLNGSREKRLPFALLLTIPLLILITLYFFDFSLFVHHVKKTPEIVRHLAYISQSIVLFGFIIFINIYLKNNRKQKNKQFRIQEELSELLAESEKLNTELAQSQKELFHASEIQNKIFDHSYDAILLANSTTSTIINCNTKAVELFEYDNKADLIGKQGLSLQKRNFTEEELAQVVQTLKVDKKTWTSDLEYITKHGNLFWGNLAISEIELEGEIFHLVRVINISDKKEYEREINDLKNYYLTTLEHQQGLNFRYVQVEEGFKVTLARGRFLEKFNIETKASENKLLHELFDEEEYKIREPFYKKAWTGEACYFEAKVPDIDVYYLVYLNPVFHENKVVEVVGSSVDISEIKIKDQLLTKQNAELHKLNEALDRFVYSASHDLRAPIASCLGLINIAKNETDITLIHNYLSLKEKSLNKLDRFIGDILDYSRNTRLPVKKETVNLKELVHSVFENYSYTEQYNGIKKEIEITDNVDLVSDNYRLNVIFNNLLSNAIRYYNPYVNNAYIKVMAKITEEKCLITISDNGLGIDNQHINRIFEMFYRATDKQSGSGLGLYIVKEHTEKLGGEVEVYSKLGEGTTFNLILPNFLKHSTYQVPIEG